MNRVIHHLSEIDSTNTYAFDLLSTDQPIEGTIISTDFQTAGRGQMGSSWASERGQNLTMSMILYPHFLSPDQQFKISQITSLAILEVLNRYLPFKASIKWPNDIFVQQKKIAGILIQNSLKGKQIAHSVIGIGLNINQQHFEQLPMATSMALIQKEPFQIFEIREAIAAQIGGFYRKLRNGYEEAIHQQYLEHLFLMMEPSNFRETKTGNLIHGQIVGVTPSGLLQIAHSKGISDFAFKEVSYTFQ